MITGWITNKGKIIECKPYNHFDVDDDDLLNLWDEYVQEIQIAFNMCNGLAEAGEHPEWHYYEITQNDCKNEAYSDAYKLGYLRISPWIRIGEIPMLAVEGLSKFINTHKLIIKELANKYECRIKIFKR